MLSSVSKSLFQIRTRRLQWSSASFSAIASPKGNTDRGVWAVFPQQQQRQAITAEYSSYYYIGMLIAMGVATVVSHDNNKGLLLQSPEPTLLDAGRRSSSTILAGDVIQAGTPIKEPSTGILFPQVCNGFDFTGCGVRVKWGLIKVYAVGTYLDRMAISAVKNSKDRTTMEQALLDPDYPRTIRIVMARDLAVKKFTSAIVEALEPRMKGQDLDKLKEFQELMPPVDLVKGSEILMTIRGESLLFKNATGGIGEIRSKIFTTALCDVYYGKDAVSRTHKESVVDGMAKL